MEKIVIATHNKHKYGEFKEMLKGRYELISLDEVGMNEEIPETGTTFRENARQKAEYIREWGEKRGEWAKRGVTAVMADDSGLEVMALGGRPGVYSARYAGEGCTPMECMEKLLREMEGKEDRRARFVTVIAVVGCCGEREVRYYEGEVRGTIIEEMRGEGGFGYDPLFVPEGEEKTFAELGNEVKNGMSHRANAVKGLRTKD